MKRFFYNFFCSWTAILTVTAVYVVSRALPEGDIDRAAMSMACQAAFVVLLTAEACKLLYTKWIRPTGYVLIQEDSLAVLVDMAEEYQDRVAEEDGA